MTDEDELVQGAELLRATDVSRTIAGATLLGPTSLTIRSGERIAVTGPSGCGKSLFLRSIALLEPIDTGSVYWKGHPVADRDVPRFRSQVVYLAQQPARSGASVETYLKAPFELSIHRQRTFDQKRISKWLSDVDKDPLLLRKIHGDLSGGELQIIALIRAMQLDPLVMLMDEPTTGLDLQAVEKVETLVHRWFSQDPNRAYVWVSHDPGQSRRMCDRELSLERTT